MKKHIEVKGYCDTKFLPVKDAFRKNFEEGFEVGSSLAVMLDGKFVVDLWSGYTDTSLSIPWEENTIVNVFSTTKVMTSLCCHVLIDRGLIDVNKPVGEYWPEFGQNGKENILVKHLLSHSAGLPTFGENIITTDLYDWQKIINILSAQKPWYKAGSKFGYHMITFGFLVGELVKRVSGKTLGKFFRDEIAIPFDIDFHIGLSEKHDVRVADIIPSEEFISKFQLNLVKLLLKKTYKVFFNPNLENADFNSREWRASEIPASNGHGNARSIAKLGSILACGGELNGKRLISSDTVLNAINEQISGRDPILLFQPMKWGLGFGLENKILLRGPRSFYWSGAGGSFCVMDLDKKLSIGYAMNKMSGLKKDLRNERLSEAVWKVINE